MQDYFSWLGAGGLSAGLQVKDANLDLIIICICQTLWDENMHKRLLCKEQTTGNAGDARSYTKKKKQIRISATICPRFWPGSSVAKKIKMATRHDFLEVVFFVVIYKVQNRYSLEKLLSFSFTVNIYLVDVHSTL